MSRTTLSVINTSKLRAAGNNDFKHMLMAGSLQSFQKTPVNITRLVHDSVEQLFSCFYRSILFGLNGLQLLQCESVRLKHAASNFLCVDCR